MEVCSGLETAAQAVSQLFEAGCKQHLTFMANNGLQTEFAIRLFCGVMQSRT